MKFIVSLLLIFSTAWGADLKVMNFNTMCDFCKGSDFFNYGERLKDIAQSIKRNDPDIVSLQEIRSASQVKDLIELVPQYKYIAVEHLLVSYADPTILYKKDKIQLVDFENIWLGPNKGKFSLGWKSALPRQILKAQFNWNNRKFYFLSGHFDNIRSNLEGSVQMLQDIIKETSGPLIFAADTNIALDMKLYKKLIVNFKDSFDIKQSFQVLGNYQNDEDLCYLRKGKVFPTCRVEHVLLNDKYQWEVGAFSIDATKNEKGKFPSDHRAFIVEINLPKDAPLSSSSN